eukprot:3492585-Rhodomonas_salina.2
MMRSLVKPTHTKDGWGSPSHQFEPEPELLDHCVLRLLVFHPLVPRAMSLRVKANGFIGR